MWDGFTIPPQVSPQQGNTIITLGGTPVQAIPPGALGGYIWNPYLASDQGLSASEPIYVNPISGPTLEGFGSTVVIYPNGTFMVPVANSTYGIWVNAASTGHKFTAVYWMGP